MSHDAFESQMLTSLLVFTSVRMFLAVDTTHICLYASDLLQKYRAELAHKRPFSDYQLYLLTVKNYVGVPTTN